MLNKNNNLNILMNRDILTCDECKGPLIESEGQYVCKNCGLVHDTIITESSYQLGNSVQKSIQRRAVQYGSTKNDLVLVNPLGSSIGTVDEYLFRDSKGALLDEHSQAKFRKFKKCYHVSAAMRGKETDNRTMKVMNKIFSQLQIPKKVAERAVYLYYHYKKNNEDKISNHVVLSAVAIFVAIRENKESCPITLKELVQAYENLKHRVSGRTLLKLMQDLNIKPTKIGIQKSENYVFRLSSIICNNRVIKNRIEKKYAIDAYVYEKILQLITLKMLEQITPEKRGGRRPYSFAAACIYVADKLLSKKMGSSSALTQKLVATATNVAEFTVREHSELIFSYNFDDILTEFYKKLSTSFEDS